MKRDWLVRGHFGDVERDSAVCPRGSQGLKRWEGRAWVAARAQHHHGLVCLLCERAYARSVLDFFEKQYCSSSLSASPLGNTREGDRSSRGTQQVS